MRSIFSASGAQAAKYLLSLKIGLMLPPHEQALSMNLLCFLRVSKVARFVTFFFKTVYAHKWTRKQFVSDYIDQIEFMETMTMHGALEPQHKTITFRCIS